MDQISGTTSTDDPTQAQDGSQPADAIDAAERQDGARPGFGSRGRARRRARFLRKARELGYRDLGGLVFNLHRFGQRNDALVLAKLNTLGKLDAELRALEHALGEREPVTVLREAGITACPRCAAIHSSEDHFCPNCGLPMARNVDLPIAGPAVQVTPPAPATGAAPSPPAAAAQSPPAAVSAQPSTPAAQTPSPPGPARDAAAGAAAGSLPPAAPPAAANPAPAVGSSASAPPPPTASHAPVPAHPPGAAAGSGREEPTEILRPDAPGP
ncbi:MAG TPA: zinc ribbon domain-containing protein [Solirubrobacteraceae bacterium]|nr:zinc ribbon domain-containing protein [Solirubrobacteraceae bacterium]